MTILNVDEIEKYGITEQPAKYNSEEELIKWLKYDLLQQARRKCKEPNENNIITITDEEEKDYTLNIGETNNEKIIFDFDINMNYNFFFMNNNETNYKINLNSIIFNKFVSFKNIKFNNNVNIQYSYFNNKFDLFEITFDKDVNFSNSVFNKEKDKNNSEYYFYKVTFNQNAFFRSISIKHKIIFSNIYLENKFNLSIIESYNAHIEFDNIHFKNANSYLNIFHVDKNIHKIILKNTIIEGKIELKNIKVNEADFKGSVINGGLVNPVNFKVHKFANRESALFLKNEAYARNNVIDALEYKAKEIECHKNDLMKSAKDIIQNKEYSFTKKTKELYKIVGDIASIYLSSLYSDNGQNWIRAFICTILFPTVFFTLSYNIYNIPIFIFVLISFLFIPLCDNTKITKYIFISMFTYLILFIPIQNYIFSILIDIDNKTFIKELLSYITPTNFNQIILDKTNESYIYKDNTIIRAISYFLGKIAFWYGSVQTVQAFRKFAKGA